MSGLEAFKCLCRWQLGQPRCKQVMHTLARVCRFGHAFFWDYYKMEFLRWLSLCEKRACMTWIDKNFIFFEQDMDLWRDIIQWSEIEECENCLEIDANDEHMWFFRGGSHYDSDDEESVQIHAYTESLKARYPNVNFSCKCHVKWDTEWFFSNFYQSFVNQCCDHLETQHGYCLMYNQSLNVARLFEIPLVEEGTKLDYAEELSCDFYKI